MSEPEVPEVLVCPPACWGPSGVRGSSLGSCSACNVVVHIAPSGRRLMAKHPLMRILCRPCAAAKAMEIIAAGETLTIEPAALHEDAQETN